MDSYDCRLMFNVVYLYIYAPCFTAWTLATKHAMVTLYRV